MNYRYPSTIEEIKEGETYQIKYPMARVWSMLEKFTHNICNSKKDNFKYLISNKRLRLIR